MASASRPLADLPGFVPSPEPIEEPPLPVLTAEELSQLEEQLERDDTVVVAPVRTVGPTARQRERARSPQPAPALLVRRPVLGAPRPRVPLGPVLARVLRRGHKTGCARGRSADGFLRVVSQRPAPL